jgi:DHA1 family bicyclomycin/chloramphenicol resistance-like MFS transporter
MNPSSVRSLAVLLAMLTAVAPLAIDMYLPAMQVMATSLQTDIHRVELSISTFLLGYAVGQLIGGPMSDRLGRKPVIFIGLTLFALTSLILSQISSIDSLLLWRFIQAIGGGMAIVNSSAMIRDLFDGDEVARVMSMVAMVMMSAPLLAPLLGAQVVEYVNWQSIFLLLACYALLVVALVSWKLPESKAPSDARKGPLIKNYLSILRHRQAMGYVLAITFGFSGMFAFITASAFVYLELFGATTQQFPLLFGANIIVMMLMNRLNMWALNHYQASTILQFGLLLQLAAGLGLIVASQLGWGLYVVVGFNMIFVGSLGLIAANATSSALNYFPHISGTATAIIGVSEFTIGALVGWIWAMLHDGTLGPMAWVMTGCALIGLTSVKLLSRSPKAVL